ncbi:branched-chain-amino-acid transaminase bat2 [Saitoella coloradoensis]
MQLTADTEVAGAGTAAIRSDSDYLVQDTPSSQAPLDASKLLITRCKSLKVLPTPLESRDARGQHFTDHMLQVEWTLASGWSIPRITPYGNLCLDPATQVFHYAMECFEGMKAYKDKEGRVRMFRPEVNMERMCGSAERISLPTFEAGEMTKLLAEFLRVEERWVPDEFGQSLYLRPTLISTDPSIGVAPPRSALFYIIARYEPVSVFPPPTPWKLFATTEYVRAWPGGYGSAKLGANYGPSVKAQVAAAKEGYQQNLWLWGEEDEITEVGTMNFFVVLEGAEGRELVTPPLSDAIIAGVTRRSVLELAGWRLEGLKVSERKLTMKEVCEAAATGKLLECFGTGTHYFLTPIGSIRYREQTITVPGEGLGDIGSTLRGYLADIMWGVVDHEWSIVV